MADAIFQSNALKVPITAATALAEGEIFQLPDGRAGIATDDLSAGDSGTAYVSGRFLVTKTTGIEFLDGGRIYWDASASSATFRKVNDRDFYLGRASGDASSTSTDAYVHVNANPPYDVDVLRDAVLSVPVGTQAVGGFGYPKVLGGVQSIELTATSEAQKIDLLSVDGFDYLNCNPIIEAIIRVPDGDAAGAGDFNIGLANGTHATDADSITEQVFFHIDGNSTTIKAQSKDGTTTVAATSTTKSYTAGSAVANRKELWIDLRDPASGKLYVDAVRVLSGTTFDVSAGTGPGFLLAHLEKTSSTDTMRVVVDALMARFQR